MATLLTIIYIYIYIYTIAVERPIERTIFDYF